MTIKFNAYKIVSTGTTIAATTSSSNAALPTTADANDGNPRFVRVLPEAACYIKFGGSSVAATLNDILVQPDVAEIFAVRGCTYIAAITRSGSANVNVTPLEM